ncbi:MAG: hypothetical protein JNL98_41020, partial [Bryobacterales bacterium]|nr:hypothetical protein [Bryobacterales bacterium]
ASYTPVHRYPSFYGLPAEFGLKFNFNYNLVDAPASFEDSFFAFLASNATPVARTLYQDQYNAQTNSLLDVTQNHNIPAVKVEEWLAQNAGGLVDTTRYTIFFINWWGRSDFKFHVYRKNDDPDPDTQSPFGTRSSRALTAWGGTAANDAESGNGALRRIWFHDLSAGPEFWTDNWNVDTADLDGNGKTDYRMPPIWEYGSPKPTYRPFNSLSRDLGLIARFVAIDLLFTTSPLYKPAISAPKLPGGIQLDVHVWQGDRTADGKSFYRAPYAATKLSPLQPYHSFSSTVADGPLTGRALDVYGCFLSPVSCYGNRLFGISFGDLFLYHGDHLNQFIEGDAPYELPVFLYNTTDALGGGGLLGFADDNWRDGTQSFVFGFLSPLLRNAGFGFTSTVVHEAGHHLGMSHPHDGYDSELNLDFFNADSFYFANYGDESSTVMSYLSIENDFGQFDRDNMNRYMTVHFINQANAILASIYKSPRAGNASATLQAADTSAAAALSAYQTMNYAGSVVSAKDAYQKVLAAAAEANVKVEPQSYTADYRSKGASSKFVDRVDYKRLAP